MKDVSITAQAISNGPINNQADQDPRPEDVRILSKRAGDAADMYRLVKESHFPALGCKVVEMLLELLADNYTKIYNELCENPWVKEQRELAEAEARRQAGEGENN